MGSPFFLLRDGGGGAMPGAIYGSQAVRSMGAFCAPLWRAATSIDRELPEAAPYDFLRSAPAPRPPDCYRSASAAAGTGPAPARPKARIADAKVA